MFDGFFNAVFGPIMNLPDPLNLFIIAFILTGIITLAYKYLTDQKKMRELKDEMKSMQKRMKELKEHPDKMMALQKDSRKCNQCGVCTEVCPMDIDTVRTEMKKKNVSSFDCVLCLKCIEQCPKDGCLSLEYGGFPVVKSRYPVKNR